MWHTLKRFTSWAIMLASLSLFLVGCGGIAGDSKAPATNTNTISGYVSNITTGRPISDASITAFTVDTTGQVSSTSLSLPANTRSDGWGAYHLNIPKSFTGPVLVQANVSGTLIRALLPSILHDETVMLNLATEMVYQYILQNRAGLFTVNNIREAVLMLEPFFGLNFIQTPPPSLDSAPTPAQQNLIVAIQAVNSLLASGQTMAGLVTVNPATGTIGLGSGTTLTALNAAIIAATNALIKNGTIPNTYTPPTITPLTQATAQGYLADTTPPAPPTGLTATATHSTVSLAWNPALPVDGVTAYYIYRNGVFIASVSNLSFIDTLLASATDYTYQVLARDAAGNLSPASTVNAKTQPVPAYTISGRVSLNGAGLANVSLALTGAGTGITTTDANGNYSFAGVREGSYSITPALTGYLFAPASRIIYVSTANVIVPDFIAAQIGTVTGGITYPDGTIVTTITLPDGSVVTTTTYPSGAVVGSTTYPAGTVIAVTTYPNGTIATTTTYPDGSIISSMAYPVGMVITSTTYPDGTVTTTISYPNGAVIGNTNYPAGTVVTSTTYPDGTLTAVTTYPNGVISTSTSYPNGAVVGNTNYPAGTVITSTTYPDGTLTTVTTYPNGTVTTATTYPNGVVTSATSYPNGAVIGNATYPPGTIVTSTTYPNGTVAIVTGYPSGTVTTVTTYANGMTTTSTAYPTGTVSSGTLVYP